MQRADDKPPNRKFAAFREEGLDAQIGIDSIDFRGVHRSSGLRCDGPIVDPLASELHRDRPVHLRRSSDSQAPDIPQVGRDLVRQHLAKSEAEQMRSIPAVRAGYDVTSDPRRAPWPSVAKRAAVSQTSTDGEIGIDVTDAIVFVRALALRASELSLKQFP